MRFMTRLPLAKLGGKTSIFQWIKDTAALERWSWQNAMLLSQFEKAAL
jgi:hypothetical protein